MTSVRQWVLLTACVGVGALVMPRTVQSHHTHPQTISFDFAPARINAASTYTEGHAHLYINGKKVTRLYGNWYYLSDLPPGSNTLKVTLNGNGHEALVYQGKPISDTEVIQVDPQP